jgi:mannobiose 2-epimerase
MNANIEAELSRIRNAMESELRENILPFWLNHTVDRENGGFYGAITNDLQIQNDVERSLVLCARILWTFSAAYRKYSDPSYLEMARHAYRYLTEKFLDRTHGGMFWWLDRSGRPINDRKQTYGQAFAIYGLSEYFLAAGDADALRLAQNIFNCIEKYAREPLYGGYIEGCAQDWGRLPDMRLSPKEPFNCPKSMNTLLHVLEGYTNLLRAWPDPRLIEAQTNLLRVFLEHVVDPQTHFTRLFFENDWTSIADLISYGHDIETSWLLVEAAEVLGNEDLIEGTRRVAVRMAEAVYANLDSDGSVMAEGSPRGIHHPEKHWWCEAEGVVGFLNAYQISGDETFARAAVRIWDFINTYMVDRQHGEWFKILRRDGTPVLEQVKTGPWEDPYHHSRACLEVIRRIDGK